MTETTNQGNGMATGGLVVGIVSIVLFFTGWIGLIVGVVGLVLSIMGKKKAASLNGVGKGAAQGGLITSIIGIVLSIVWVVVLMMAAAALMDAGGGAFEDAMREAMENAGH